MPHFGLMDEYALPPHEAALIRARLHIRSGRRRIRQGKVREGLMTLYDALYHGMRYYLLLPDNMGKFKYADGGQRTEEMALYELLREKGAVDGSFDFKSFFTLIEKIIDGADLELKCDEILKNYDKIMA